MGLFHRSLQFLDLRADMRSLLALVPIDGVAERMQPMRPLVLEPGALALEAEALDCRFRSAVGKPD